MPPASSPSPYPRRWRSSSTGTSSTACWRVVPSSSGGTTVTDDSIVLIGAGSTVFTPGLLTDLASSPVFDEFTVHLVDLEAEAAEVMAALGRRIAQQHGSRLRVEAHTDRRDALAGARFVATTIA